MDEFYPNTYMFSNPNADAFLDGLDYDGDWNYLDSFPIPSSHENPPSMMMPMMIEQGYPTYPQDIYPVPNFSQYQQQQQQQEQQQQLESIALEKTQSTQSSASTDSTNSMFYSSTDEDMQRSDPLTINPRSSLSSRRPASTEYFPIVLGHEIRIESPNLIACECGGKFTGEKPKNVRSNYKRHCKSRRKEARIVCQVCSKVSNRLDNHRQHLKTH